MLSTLMMKWRAMSHLLVRVQLPSNMALVLFMARFLLELARPVATAKRMMLSNKTIEEAEAQRWTPLRY